MAMTVVTLSASYGAGGSQVGPRLADRLGVPFIDRVIPTTVAERLAVPLDDALAHDDAVRGALERMLMRFAPAAQAFSGAATPPEMVDERSFLRATEDVIRERCARRRASSWGAPPRSCCATGPARCTSPRRAGPSAGWPRR